MNIPHDSSARPAVPLPRRQRQVLSCLQSGGSEKQIAARLGVSPHTVHTHVRAIYRRLGVRSRGELLSLWITPTTTGGVDAEHSIPERHAGATVHRRIS